MGVKLTDEFPFSSQTRKALELALREDIGRGDVTSEMLIPSQKKAGAVIYAKEAGVFSGEPVLQSIFRLVDPALKVRFMVQEGKRFKKNSGVVSIDGSLRSILKAERTALNLLGRTCGISTLTRKFVQKVKGYPVFILDTRKTMPLWREIDKYAVRTGGGRNHRMGLYDRVFVKENHRRFGEFKNLKKCKGQFEIEVRNVKEMREAMKLEPCVILFDNFKPAALTKAVREARRLHPHVILEASGGITLENVAHYAAMGVDWISIGSLTHSVKSIDFSLLVK